MSNCSLNGSIRTYRDILLEEIALEGLDGITLELLWKRLRVNSDWKILPIDPTTEKFIWRELLILDYIKWYELEEPRKSPPVFSTSDDLIDAVEKEIVDVQNISSSFYPHHLINDKNVIGSCPSYLERSDVSREVKTMSYAEAYLRWGNKLVLVADQIVRNYMLFPPNLNPACELSDISYCLLERIGRSRRCGEISLSLNFLRNGANPTFYFWNKLRLHKIIKTQGICIMGIKRSVSATLIHLPRFYKQVISGVACIVLQIIEKIKSNPRKMCLYSDVKELIHSKHQKVSKNEYFRRHLKFSFIPYKEYYPDSPKSEWFTANGGVKLVRILQLTHENGHTSGESSSNSVEKNMNEIDIAGILEGKYYFNRPLISQCYNFIAESQTNGMTMVDVQNKLGVSKLIARMLFRNLQKFNLIISVSSDNAKKQNLRYFSMKYNDALKSKVLENVGKFAELMDTSTLDDVTPSLESSSTDMNIEISDDIERVSCNDNSEENCRIRVADKRPLPIESEGIEEIERLNVKKRKTESSPSQEPISVDVLQNKINSALSSLTECSIPVKGSMFTMRRLNIVLDYIYRNEVVQHYNISKAIIDEEIKRGISQGIPCRKSLKKIVDVLTKSNKIKVIKKMVQNAAMNKSRELIFLCTPSVSEDHPVIQSAIQEVSYTLSVLYLKNGRKKDKKNIPFLPRKPTTRYGYTAKFSRVKILHEILTYVLYHYEGDENLDVEECRNFVQPLLLDSDSVEDLPKFYKKEMSWKMFIPPVMKYEEYADGWISQNDLAERLPLKLFFAVIQLPYDHPDIEHYLQHPIKQYYLMRNLPPHLQEFLSVDNKYLYSLCLNLRILCYVGLIQFGPKSRIRGFQNLIYLNKKAQLLDTRRSSPAYLKVSPHIKYPEIEYDFTIPECVENFWNDAIRFAIGTKLGRKNYREDKSTRPRQLPDRLSMTTKPRNVSEAPSFDDGKLPGDKLGAAGFDSWLCAHLINQWFLNKTETKTVTATVLKEKAPPKPPKQLPPKLMSKLVRFRHKVIRKAHRYKVSHDKVDMEALSKMKTTRAKWNKTEDEILLMCHIASKYYSKPVSLSVYRPYILFRKILHNVLEKSTDKTLEACKRRVVNLLKNAVKQHSVNLCLKEMANDAELNKKYKDICDEIEKFSNAKNLLVTKNLLDQLTEDVFFHLYRSKKMSLLKKGTYEISLPDTIEEFKKIYHHEYAVIDGNYKYLPVVNKKDTALLSIINLIFSTLFCQVDKSKVLNVNFLYGIFKQFDDSYLKAALHYIRTNRLISYNKSTHRNRGLFLPFGKGVYHLSLMYHKILKAIYFPAVFSFIHCKYLDDCSDETCEKINVINFDAGLNLLLVTYFVHNNIKFSISIPENMLSFNTKPMICYEPDTEKAVIRAQNASVSLLCEQFFNSKDENELIEEDAKISMSDGEDDEDKLIDFGSSKISIYVTRNQFKHADVRFSNAYDHYLLNPFPLAYSLFEKNHSRMLDSMSRQCALEMLEKSYIFTKIKYSADEFRQKIQQSFHDPRERDCAIALSEFLIVKDVHGATSEMLRNEFEDLHLLKRIVNYMIRKKLIIRSGSIDTRYVHINCAESWLIRSCKNKDVFVDENRDPKTSTSIINRRSADEFNMNNRDKLIWLAIRPWIQINGSLNVPALDSLLVRILSYIVKTPFSSMMRMQKKCLPALQPHCTRELVEFLEQLKCVKLFTFTVKNKTSLFSSERVSSINENTTGFEDEDTIILEPDVDAFVKFSMFLSSSRYEDLLDIKYSDGFGHQKIIFATIQVLFCCILCC